MCHIIYYIGYLIHLLDIYYYQPPVVSYAVLVVDELPAKLNTDSSSLIHCLSSVMACGELTGSCYPVCSLCSGLERAGSENRMKQLPHANHALH